MARSPRSESNRSDPIVPLEAIRPNLDDDPRPGREERLPVRFDRVGCHVLPAQLEGRLADRLALDERGNPGDLDVIAARHVVDAQHDPRVAPEVPNLDRRLRSADPE